MTGDDLKQSAVEHFEERAGILEFDANLSREQAERQAKIETADWLKSRRPDDEAQP